MNNEARTPRFLRDRVTDKVKDQVELLLDRIICQEPGGNATVGHVVEASQRQLDMERQVLERIESVLDRLREPTPDLANVISELIEAADTLKISQEEIQNSLQVLLHDLNPDEFEAQIAE